MQVLTDVVSAIPELTVDSDGQESSGSKERHAIIIADFVVGDDNSDIRISNFLMATHAHPTETWPASSN